MNELKTNIKNKLSNNSLNNLFNLIKVYEKTYPYDLDLYTIKINYYLYTGNINQAFDLAQKGLRINPCNAHMYYNLAKVSEELCDFKSAYENYSKALSLFELANEKSSMKLADVALERIATKLDDLASSTKDSELLTQLLDICKYVDEHSKNLFEIFSEPFKNYNNFIDSVYDDGKGINYFIANYNYWYFLMSNKQQFPSDLISRKGEFVRIHTTNTTCRFNEECDILLPLFFEERNMFKNIYKIHTDSVQYDVYMYPEHFNYLRLPGKVEFESDSYFNTVIGKPILLKQDPDKKKLILNIFVDGLPQVLVNSPDFEQYMPNTKEFFSKGIICNNVYANAEWTYPSVATIFSGLYASNHMMVHPNMNIPFPKDARLLSEYFQEAGYYTAKIGGNWRITPNYGYLRGFDRLIYQHRVHGLNYDETIHDTIEHLEMASETNQFLWIEIGDLHDVADELDLPPSVQAKVSLIDISGTVGGTTSVKQQYNKHKINLLNMYAKRVDLSLLTLYNYINQNYKDSEVIISLFSDHGQGYMVRENEHFFAPGRSNTALMIRSSYRQGTICDEYISTADYLEIMGKLANLPIASTKDSNLPLYFGGTQKRPYTISECLHAGDNYCAAFHSEDHTCYITAEDKVDYDGRFDLRNYSVTILDKEKNKMEDSTIEDYFLNELRQHIAHLQHY